MHLFRGLALPCLAVFLIACGSPTGPDSDPGPSVHAELVSQAVFLGNCLANLTNCAGEISPSGDVFGGARYDVPNGALVTVRACTSHPGVAKRDLYVDMRRSSADRTPTPDSGYREEDTPSPVCVGVVYQTALGTLCVGNGGISIREYVRDKIQNAVFICGVDAGNGYIPCGASEKSLCLVNVR